MHRSLVPAFAIAALAVCASASAQVYKWKDASGTTHYSDAPPPAGSKYDKVTLTGNVTTPSPASSTAPAAPAADSTPANIDQAGKTVPDTPDNRAQLCKQLESNIALLSSKQSVTASNGKTSTSISDEQRQQALVNAQSQKQKYCR